jgi:hypothetical protein
MHFTRELDIGSLQRIFCECCGFSDVPELIDRYLLRERCPALCLTCGYVEEKEPETFGWCPVCDSDTMRSALILAGIL